MKRVEMSDFTGHATDPLARSAGLSPAVALAVLIWGSIGTTSAVAHVFRFTDVLVLLKTNETYQIDITVDVDALALGVPSTADSKEVVAAIRTLTQEEFARAVQQARDTIRKRVRIRFDGEKDEPIVSFPDYETISANEADPPTVLGVTARLTGRIPQGAKELTFGASRAFSAVNLTILDQKTLGGARYALGPDEENPPYRLGAASAISTIPGSRYLLLGYQHIMPNGLDHMLFVLGLFLLSIRIRPLLWQVTAFTVAHSVTLGLAMYGLVSLPSRVVEPLIALSIAYVAIENLLTSELKPWRPAVVFCFGLLHGLGFAGALRELGLPRNDFATALVLFNVGVELGQLSVVAIAFLAVGWFRRWRWYRTAIVLPISTGIALVGLYWAAQRALGW